MPIIGREKKKKKNGYNEVRDIFEKRSKNLGKIILSILVEKRGKTLALALILNFDDVTQMLWAPEGSISVSRCLLVFDVSFSGIGVWHDRPGEGKPWLNN